MRPAPNLSLRSFRALDAEQPPTSGEGGANSDNSFAGKGWTNGGGDRVFTAAQFSRIAESSALHLPTNPATTLAANRSHSPAAAAPTTTAVPLNEAAMLAPVGAALERLLTRGQDQLAVTVRFEQGGSLSLKLALRDGTVATHIQTDVPGLQEALRSAWNNFSHDWNQRGIKLNDPSFSSGLGDASANRDGHRANDREGHAFSADSTLFGPTRGAHATRTHGRATSIHPAETPATPAAPYARGLRTWA